MNTTVNVTVNVNVGNGIAMREPTLNQGKIENTHIVTFEVPEAFLVPYEVAVKDGDKINPQNNYPVNTDTYEIGDYTGGKFLLNPTDWYTDEALTQKYNFNAPVTTDITLYGKWKVQPQSNPELRGLVSAVIKIRGRGMNLNFIETSLITSMSSLFTGSWASFFNGSVSEWNVSNVTNMSRMFGYTPFFNQPIGNWDVSKVTNMSGMFLGAEQFNQDISKWNVASVTDMNEMFTGAEKFNQLIGKWDVSKTKDFSQMFKGAAVFNQDLSKWVVKQAEHCADFSDAPETLWPKAKRPAFPAGCK